MQHFTRVELEAMEVLWKNDWLKPAEILQLFPRPIRNSALRSVLSILLDKGDVVRQRRGKAYYYKAATRKEPAMKAMSRRLARIFCGGSPATMIARLIEFEKLSEADLEELRRIAGAKIERNRTSTKEKRK